MRTQAKEKISVLIDKYEKLKKAGKLQEYNEANTRKDFIMPLFEALGWDVRSATEVSEEETVSNGSVDYAFKLNGITKFYLETKKFSVDLEEERWAEQAINYAWYKSVAWAVLSDFEGLKIFNAEWKEPHVSRNRYLEFNYDEYLKRFDELWLLSKESIEQNLLDKEAEKVGKKEKRKPVNEAIFADLIEWRRELLDSIDKTRQEIELSDDEKEEVVQKLLDRLIFIRSCEDRGFEDRLLESALRTWEDGDEKEPLYEKVVEIFKHYARYDSPLFHLGHPCEKLNIFNGTAKKILKGLYFNHSEKIRYDFKNIPADILGGIYEQYLGYILKKGKLVKGMPHRKEKGIYYTPKYIVDYIVENTLGKLLEEIPREKAGQIKILDPACGSGSFLIKAFEVMDKYYEKDPHFEKIPFMRRIKTLTNNLYGVDLDEKAVEIAQLNLMLRALTGRRELPDISSNIKCGNSLISGSSEELKKYFGPDWRDKKPFNWEEEFPAVFKQDGFDIIIGNPPYVDYFGFEEERTFLADKFKAYEYQANSFCLFVERAGLLLKNHGVISFIVPAVFLTQHYFKSLREVILRSFQIHKIIILNYKVFEEAETGDTCIFIIEKDSNITPNTTNKVAYCVAHRKEDFLSISYKERPQKEFYHNERLEISLFGEKRILDKLQKQSVPLKIIAYSTMGIKPYQIGKGTPKQTENIVVERAFDAKTKQNNVFKLYLIGRDIDRYIINPQEKRYIKYGRWLAEPRPKAPFEREKIILRQTADCIRAVLDNDKYYNLNNIYNIEIKDKKYSYPFLLGILNSHLMKYVYQAFVPEAKRLFAEIKKTNLEKLPIKNINDVTLREQQQIASLVKNVLALYKEHIFIPENTNKWRKLKEEIGRLDRKIDEEVYKLYGLTKEEIRVVEEGAK